MFFVEPGKNPPVLSFLAGWCVNPAALGSPLPVLGCSVKGTAGPVTGFPSGRGGEAT